MTFPAAKRGPVIRYSFLWSADNATPMNTKTPPRRFRYAAGWRDDRDGCGFWVAVDQELRVLVNRVMRATILIIGLVFAGIRADAQTSPPLPRPTTSIAAGCAIPVLWPAHHTFYIDPVRGRDGADGSRATPWRSLSYVLTEGLISTMPDWWDAGTCAR